MERRADYSVSLRAKQDTGVRIPRDTATEYGQRGALSLTLQLIWPLDLGPEPVASAPRAASVRVWEMMSRDGGQQGATDAGACECFLAQRTASSGAGVERGGRRWARATPGHGRAPTRTEMMQTVPKSRSRKVNSYVRAVRALDAIRRKREERFVRPFDLNRDALAAEVATRLRALTGGQHAGPGVASRHCRRVGTRREPASAIVRRSHHTHARSEPDGSSPPWRHEGGAAAGRERCRDQRGRSRSASQIA